MCSTEHSTDPSEEIAELTKLLAALVEHSSEWLIAKIAQQEVQALLGLILRLTGWEGTPSVDEQISEVGPSLHSHCSCPCRTLSPERASSLTDLSAHATDLPNDTGGDHGL